MAKNDKKPLIRFKGFTDAWEQRKFDDVVTQITTGLNPRDNFTLNSGGDNYYVTIKNFEHGVLHLDEKCDLVDDEALALIQARSDLKIGDILFTSIGRVGDCYLIENTPKNWNINESVFSLRPNKVVVEPEYLFHTIHSDIVLNQILNNITGSTFKSIKIGDLKNVVVPVPSRQEQNQVAKIITVLESLITLHQRKYDKLVNVKKSLLSKMFPKNGSKIPEIRFKGFSDAWEQCKLGEVFETVTDYVAAGSFADLAENVIYRDVPSYAQLVRTTDLKNGFNSGSSVYVDKRAFDFLYRVNLDKECIILPNIGNCGEVYLVIPDNLPYKHNVLGPNAILVRSESSDNAFLSVLLQGKDFQEKLSLIISPNGQTKFNKTELKQIALKMPTSGNEQEQLGAYFRNLDRLITLHQRECEKLKNIKKSLLSRMFV